MKFRYDSWNRIQTMTYPDGEVVSFGYNRGGMLENIRGNKNGDLRKYVKDIRYNKFELKESEKYGNGTWMSYEYDSLLRLPHLYSWDGNGDTMQSISYTYDHVGNITHISNSAGSVSGLGGHYEGHYTYDNLYRLVAANGYWKNSRDSLPFSESMNYTANGRILKKTVNARILNGKYITTKSSDLRYSYASFSNQIATVTDVELPAVTQSFQWDDCGNVDRWEKHSRVGTEWLRTHTWTEDNRLQTVADNNWFSYYQYDAGGERTYKLAWAGSTSNRSGDRSIYYTPDEATLYASPYLVITPQGYTKHYYAEAERITSQLGKGQFVDVGTPVVSDSLVQVKLQAVTDNVEYPATLTIPNSGAFAYLDPLTNHQNATSTLYFYHPDHLGSSSWVTTTNGTVKQHLHYLPWGEDFVNQRSSHFDGVRYTFSAKEKDVETGYSYFGARYYSSDLSIWLSVDPMSEERSWANPYSYCQTRPMRLIDPTGTLDWIPPTDGSGNWIAQKGDGYWKLSQQAGIPLEEAKNAVIAANRNRGQNRTSETMVYPGDVVHVNANNSRTQNNNNVSYYLPYPASGRCEPVSVFDVLMEEFVREPLQAMFERFGMKEESAYWLSTSAVIIPSFVVTKKSFIGKRSIKYPGNNPAKAPVGFEWRGKPGCPPGTKGNYYNPITKESLHPDLDHPAPIGPHWDYIDPTGK